MSGRKSNLKQYQVLTNAAGTASATGTVVNIGRLDNVGFQASWTGSPSGTFAVQISADYNQDEFGNVLRAGNWSNIPTTISTTGGSPIYFDLAGLSAPWARIAYTAATASTGGVIQGWVTGKMI